MAYFNKNVINMACKIRYGNRSYTENDAVALATYHYQVYDAVIKANNQLAKKPLKLVKDSDNKFLLPKNMTMFNEARKLINSVNRTYGNVLKEVKVNKRGTITNVVKLDVSPYSDEIIDRHNRQVANEIESNEYLSKDGDVLPYDSNDKRVLPSDSQFANQELADKQATLMENKFSALGVNTFIAYDADMEVSGKLLGTSDPMYAQLSSDNELIGGTAIIVVNPNKLYADTVFHEYGHLFIDLLGGMSNARIKDASNELIGTTVEREVTEAYPELSGDNLRKEIVATALGKEATSLFDDAKQISWWKRFTTWFKNLINREVGLPKDSVLSLASELVSKDESLLSNSLSTDTQFQKEKKTEYKNKTVVERRLDNLTNIRNQIYSIINSQLKGLPKELSETNEQYKEQLTRLQSQLNKLDDTQNSTAVLAYLQMVDNNLGNIQDALNHEALKFSTRHSDLTKILAGFGDVIASFSIVSDIQDSIDKQFLDNENEYATVEDKKLVQDMVADLSARYQSTDRKIIAMSTRHVAKILSAYSNKTIVARKDVLEVEFNKANKRGDESKQEYADRRSEFIETEIEKEREALTKQDYERVFDQLNNSAADVSWIASRLNDGKSVNSTVIQLIEKILDDADVQRDLNILTLQNEANEVFKDLRKVSKGSDPKKVYEGYHEAGSDGNLYLTGQHSVEFYIEYKKLSQAVETADNEHGQKSEEHDKAFKKLSKFLKENVKAGIPTSKWKNPNYAKVKNTETYKFLMRISSAADAKTGGARTNIKKFGQIVKWHKAANIGKRGFEQISSGNLMDNFYESIKRTITAKRADETEFGAQDVETMTKQDELQAEIDRRIKAGESTADLAQEINLLVTLTNEVGDLKTNIPIFFRGQHNLKDQSYDLISLAVMDYYMAENFEQKQKIKSVVELTLDITNNKQVTQTQGMLKKTIVQAFGKDTYEEVRKKLGSDSNEAKMLESIIDNRLYGIKTIKSEYAQIANSLMAWSATTMLGFNFLAATANLVQGKVFNFIEAHGGQWYDKKDLIKGEATYWADMKNWMSDIGRPVQTSKTNQLMNLFNIQGEFKPMSIRFNEDNRFKSLSSRNSLFFMNHMGEFYIHGSMMYAILNNIKMRNGKGQYINSRGGVVSKQKAMTLSEAFTVDDKGNLKLNQHAKKTSFGNQNISLDLAQDKGVLEVRNLINKIANDMHGQYNDEYQSMFQRQVVGKMVFMLRKWIVPGFNRRWRGASSATKKKELLRPDVDVFYSEDLQTFQEGYYTSFIRFVSNLIGDFKRLGLEGAWNEGMTNLTTHEKANLRKTVMELSMLVLTLITSIFVLKQLDGLDDDDDEAMLYLAFYSRRLYSEISFFVNPLETFQIIRSPAASISYAENMVQFLSQIVSDGVGGEFEIYERGKNKGLPKAWKRTTDLLPVLNHMDRSVSEAASRIYNTN